MPGAKRIAWTTILDCTNAGPRSTLSNAVAVLQRDPRWGPDVLWHDEFLDRTLIANSPVREWRDDDDTCVTVYMQDEIKMSGLSESNAASAVRYVARQRSRHCVREWLTTLIWDGVERIAHAFEDYWGAAPSADQPCEYLRAISANLLIGIVARVMVPGCQLDHVVIFEGPQGIGKSKALRILGGEWYMLAAESVTSKDFFQGLPGKLIVEIGEMDSFSRADRERVKAAITTPTDRYRSSYGRRAEDHPRQCVFVGTSNRDDYGNDETGARRFMPVRCGIIDLVNLSALRDQLFAEAYAKFQAGASWWETPEASTKSVQRDRHADDVWSTTVLEWLVGRSDVTIAEILINALKFKTADMGRPEQLRVGGILRVAGWERRTVRRDGKAVQGWVVIVSDNSEFSV